MIETGIGVFISVVVTVAAVTDIRSRTIPNKLIYFALVCGLGLRLIHHELPLLNSFLAFIVIGGLLYIAALVSADGMGGGDIKLGAFVALMLGFPWSFVALLIGILLGGLFGTIKVLQHKTLKISIPLAPFIAIGTFITYWGSPAVIKYIENLYF
jgi:Flp pilus assembly protein protease CpaA